MKATLGLAALLVCVSVPSATFDGMRTITLTEDEARLCQTGNRCDVFHIDTLAAWIGAKMNKAFADGRAACKSDT